MADIEMGPGRAIFIPDLRPELQQALLAFWHKWWDDTETVDLGIGKYAGILLTDNQDLDDMAEKIQDMIDPEWFKK